MTTDDLRTEMRKGFKKVDERFNRVDERFNGVYGEFEKLRAEMKAEGEKTRLHFDVMVEKMQESVRLVAEATAHHAVRLGHHEKRIKRLEGPRRT
jgi:hypothetical protein